MKDKGRVTIYDIAQQLNVAPSTVTRALSNQKCVSEKTRKLVHETAEELGYKKNILAQGLKRKPVKIGLILRNNFPDFQNLVMDGAKKACEELEDFNVTGEYCMVDLKDSEQNMLKKLEEFADMGLDGIIFTPVNLPQKTGELVDSIAKEGIRIGTVLALCDNMNIHFSVFADTEISGRIAADLFAMQGLKHGDEIVLFVGGKDQEIHKNNISGFLKMNESYGFNVRIIEHQDNEMIAYYATEQLLNVNKDIRGIYTATAVTLPICKKLKELGLDTKIKMIGTELFTSSIPYLTDNTLSAIIFQNPFKQGYMAFKTMYDHIVNSDTKKEKVLINPQIVNRGNVGYYEHCIARFDSDD